MNNNELLQAISDMMDQKLEEKLEKKLEEKLEQKLAPVNERLENIETRVEAIEKLQNKEILPRLSAIEDTQNKEVLPRLKKLEISNETDIVPKFNEITDCYLSTYKRYGKEAHLIKEMYDDIQIIKLTVRSHSKDLQKFHNCTSTVNENTKP